MTYHKTTARKTLTVDHFRGVDYHNSPANVDVTRSPNAPNMIRDVPGKVRKRMGYAVTARYDGRINGYHPYGGAAYVHAGTGLYRDGTPVCSGLNDVRSVSWCLGGKLFLLDGAQLRVIDGDGVRSAGEGAYVPTVTVARHSTGGGTPYEPVNLLSAGFRDSFAADGSASYQLSFDGLDDTAVTAEKLLADGSWQQLTEGSDFTVDRTTGSVTFAAAPGASPVLGQDNLRITAYKTQPGYADRIHKCRYAVLYGVNGASDRLFVSGNPDHPNLDWYSQQNDGSYFGDTHYSILGQDGTEVLGYSIVNDALAAHKGRSTDGRNVILRHGTMENGQAAFPIINTLQGEAAVCPYSFCHLSDEPLFLTALGVYAITAADVTGEKYSQNRSFFLDRALQEHSLADACCLVYRDLYLIAVDGELFLLDGLQKSYEASAPYSAYQYECYHCTDIPARVLFEADGALCFGTADGRLCRFYRDKDEPTSYNDDGAPICAYWETPEVSGSLIHKRKDFKRLSVRLASAIVTSLEAEACHRGMWSTVAAESVGTRYFDFSYIDFGKLTFSGDTTARTLNFRINVKHADKASFRLRNAEKDEPFGIYNLALEFREGADVR